MRTGRARGHHGVVGAFEPEFDRNAAGREIDDPSRNEERRDPSRTALLQNNRGLGDALDAPDAGTDEDSRHDLIFIGRRPPTGIIERLSRGAHCKDDELIELALILRLHPLVGIVSALGAVAAGGPGRRTSPAGRRHRNARCVWRHSCRRGDDAKWARRRRQAVVSIPSPVTTTRLIFGSLTTGIDRDPSAIFYRSHLSHFPQASQHPKAG